MSNRKYNYTDIAVSALFNERTFRALSSLHSSLFSSTASFALPIYSSSHAHGMSRSHDRRSYSKRPPSRSRSDRHSRDRNPSPYKSQRRVTREPRSPPLPSPSPPPPPYPPSLSPLSYMSPPPRMTPYHSDQRAHERLTTYVLSYGTAMCTTYAPPVYKLDPYPSSVSTYSSVSIPTLSTSVGSDPSVSPLAMMFPSPSASPCQSPGPACFPPPSYFQPTPPPRMPDHQQPTELMTFIPDTDNQVRATAGSLFRSVAGQYGSMHPLLVTRTRYVHVVVPSDTPNG